MNLLAALLASELGEDGAGRLLRAVEVDPSLLEAAGTGGIGDHVPRAALAQALGLLLLHDLLGRVPSAAAYARDRLAAGARLHLDHGAVRTVAGMACGELPPGEEAFARFLRPLGYEPHDARHGLGRQARVRTWRHADLPAGVPQYLVSELDGEAFPARSRQAATRVLSSSHDPLTELAKANLDRLGDEGALPRHQAESLLGELVGCFRRHHGLPSLADYEVLVAESPEMGWIATEGATLEHAADRVDDLPAVAAAERAAGREVAGRALGHEPGRILVAAHRPPMVERALRVGEHRDSETRLVAGSFLELVSRRPLPDGSGLDLTLHCCADDRPVT